jgi:hypothetical protein
MPSTRRPAPASTAAAAAATPSTAKAKPKPKHSADDENRPGGVRWGDLQSGTAVMVSGDCSGVEAKPGEVVPATICDGAECLHLNVTRDGQVSLAATAFPNRGNRKLWVPFDHVVRVGHDAATESQDRRPRRQSSAPSAPSRAAAMAPTSAKRTSVPKPKAPPAKRPRERKPTSQSDRSSTVMKEQPKLPRRESGFQGRKRRQEAAAAVAAAAAEATHRAECDLQSEHADLQRNWKGLVGRFRSQLAIAVQTGAGQVLSALLKIDPNAVSCRLSDPVDSDSDSDSDSDDEGRTRDWMFPVHMAAKAGQTAIVSILTSAEVEAAALGYDGSYINDGLYAMDSLGMTALMHAAEQGHMATVSAILSGFAADDDRIHTLAMFVNTVRGALGTDEEIRKNDEYGQTALYFAALHGHADVASALLAAGSCPDGGRFMYGASGNHWYGVPQGASLEVGRRHKYRIRPKEDPAVCTPLMAAVGDRDIVIALLRHGASVNLTLPFSSRTSLSFERSGLSDRALNAREQAELKGHTEIARLLEDAEAESNGSA